MKYQFNIERFRKDLVEFVNTSSLNWKEVCDASGVSAVNMSRIKKHSREPTINEAFSLCRLMKFEVKSYMENTEKRNHPNE